jgi:hypothetical protein
MSVTVCWRTPAKDFVRDADFAGLVLVLDSNDMSETNPDAYGGRRRALSLRNDTDSARQACSSTPRNRGHG